MDNEPSRKDPRTANARRLRNGATPPERKLWQGLRQLELNGHFRRQAPLGPYFADFVHHGHKLIVELDGAQHGFDEQRTHDEVRTRYLARQGYRVLRFWNNEVQENLDGVIETILAALKLQVSPPTPGPSPPQAEGGECSDSPVDSLKEVL